MPELTTNLQANTVYWRECADALEVQAKQQQQQQQQQQQEQQKSAANIVPSSNEKKDRNDSIFEDNENEIDK